MGKYRIIGKSLPTLTTLSETYSVYSSYRSGKATLSLSPDGTYSFYVYGDISESTAKRCPTHKQAESKLTQKMFQAHETVSNIFMKIHQSVKLASMDSFSLAKNVEPQKFYEWKKNPVPKPTLGESIKLLQHEAESKFHNNAGSNANQYCETNKDAIHKERMEYWNIINKLFTDIEQAQESKINASYKAEYDRRAKSQQAIIDGKDTAISMAFDDMCNKLSIPTCISLDYNYNKNQSYIDVDVELLEDPALKIPSVKTSYKANGQISVKAKTQGEISQDVSVYQVALAFYIAKSVFNLSPNIQKCAISLYISRKVQALLWVEFNRSNVLTSSREASELLYELSSMNSVSNLKVLKTTARLEPIDPAKFQILIQQAKTNPLV